MSKDEQSSELPLNSVHQNTDYQSIQNPSYTQSNSKLNRLERFIKKLDLTGVETRGIERILPEERIDSSILSKSIIWISANINIPCFTTGILGPSIFKLTLYQSFFTIFLFNSIGIIPIAIISCFGPASGLRTTVFGRYSWGYYGASIIGFCVIISGLGWSAIYSITSAQALRVVFDNQLSIAFGIIIISLIVLIVSFVGYKWIHHYEQYSWIPIFIAFCIVAICSVKNIKYSQKIISENKWNYFSIISFGALCIANPLSWSSVAADYNTYLPENSSQMKIFLFTYLGNFVGIIPLQFLGTAVYIGTYTNENWAHAYKINNVGGLLGATVSSLGIFGKFLLLLFSLSTISTNVMNTYSSSLSFQVIAPIFQHIPRIFYAIISTILYVILALISEDHFNESLVSFMSLCLCFVSIFITILLEEHFIFRRCSYENYNFNLWNNRKDLRISFAAIFSGFIGIIGFSLGMSQKWYQGPIATALSTNNQEQGPDLGFLCLINVALRTSEINPFVGLIKQLENDGATKDPTKNIWTTKVVTICLIIFFIVEVRSGSAGWCYQCNSNNPLCSNKVHPSLKNQMTPCKWSMLHILKTKW
ncbi:hypothetical protein I4U23_005907 [Adineta vaga]|nr:hypothetical protein I4U23_005907 [Adineta vaga]